MKIVDVKCAVIGKSPIVRLVTDEGVSGYAQFGYTKQAVVPTVAMLKPALIGQDPTNVERVMRRIRSRGGFKPWGTAVSAVEMALWDLAGKAAGLPVHKLLGGKVRDKVRAYNGAWREPLGGYQPDDYAAWMRSMMARPEGFSIIKVPLAFHSAMPAEIPDFTYTDYEAPPFHGYTHRGALTEVGFNHIVACVEAAKAVAGDTVGLAIDGGPGWALHDAIRFAKAVEPLHLLWLEDMLTGDYVHFTNPDVYRELTASTTTPIHTGEQVYLRQNFKPLIEGKAVNIVGPDPCDVGGIAELKWIAEYADLHGIMIAPHGVGLGLFGMAAQVQVGAVMPDNFIAFECPIGNPEWWNEIVEGYTQPLVVNGFVEVSDRPGMGIEFNVERASQYLKPGDEAFFD